MDSDNSLKQGWEACLASNLAAGASSYKGDAYVSCVKDAIKAMEDAINNHQQRGQGLDFFKGFVLEEWAAGTFNIDAVAAGSSDRARVMHETGYGSVDVRLYSGDQIQDYSMKAYNTPEAAATAQAILNKDTGEALYKGQKRLVQEDFVKDAKAAADRRYKNNILTRPKLAESYHETDKQLVDTIDNGKGIKGRSIDSKDLKKATKAAQKGEGEFKAANYGVTLDSSIDMKYVMEQAKQDDKIEIIFEGAPDEYNDLKSLAETDKYSNEVSVSYGDRKLENARDILPKVADTFNLMRPLIDEKISEQPEVSKDLSRFSETASNRVPLVVIGNYSGGKSTFINALIGKDILSSSEQPLTAKIYRIRDLKEEGKAVISFQYLGEDVEITFTEKGYSFTKGGIAGELSSRLDSELKDCSDMYATINKTLLYLADLEANTEDTEISDLIQVEVPFARKGILGNSSKDFVIFDTPGSNSKTHGEHSEVLQKALGDMSNGLPIYVSTSETLDTCDNDKLCEEIKSMEQFDDRFTLIIVNKADRICFEERRDAIVVGSHDYWVESSKLYKELLMKIVTGSDLSQEDNSEAQNYIERLKGSIRGNFPGARMGDVKAGTLPCLGNNRNFSVASVTNIPTEKSEKFISQTIEKLLDGIIPEKVADEYVLILLATPIDNVEERKLRLGEIYSGLKPYESWQTNYTVTEQDTRSSMATAGVNIGASAGIQNGTTNSITNNKSETDSDSVAKGENSSYSDQQNESDSNTQNWSQADATQQSQTKNSNYGGSTQNSYQRTEGKNASHSDNSSTSKTNSNTTITGDLGSYVYDATHGGAQEVANEILKDGFKIPIGTTSNGTTTGVTDTIGTNSSQSWGSSSGSNWSRGLSTMEGASKTITTGEAIARTVGRATINTVGSTLTQTVGKAVTTGLAVAEGVFKSTSLGVNFGANFARSSTVTVSVGKNDGITQNHVNYNVKHALC